MATPAKMVEKAVAKYHADRTGMYLKFFVELVILGLKK